MHRSDYVYCLCSRIGVFISSFDECLFSSIAHFLIGLFGIFSVVLDISPLSEGSLQRSSPSVKALSSDFFFFFCGTGD